jgi:hypothetical protein
MSDKKSDWHTRKWYKENYGVDPLKLTIPYIEKKNPYYSSASPMKLWKEDDVKPFKSEEGIEKFKKRREAGKKAFRTRRKRLVKWFEEIKSNNPKVNKITHRLWEIGMRISDIHEEKERCREKDRIYDKREYWEFGLEHCKECQKRTREQDKLRDERQELFERLERICDNEKRVLQLARKYCREDKKLNNFKD